MAVAENGEVSRLVCAGTDRPKADLADRVLLVCGGLGDRRESVVLCLSGASNTAVAESYNRRQELRGAFLA